MSVKVGFYLLGKKGYAALLMFVEEFSSDSIGFVVGAKDNNIDNDYYLEIYELCIRFKIAFFEREHESQIDVGLNVAIGWRWMLEVNDLIVFHDSLLPKYRGFSPLVNMLIEGEDEIGVTALIGSEEYDKGNILGVRKIPVEYPIKISDAINKVSKLYSELLCSVFSDWKINADIKGEEQDEALATYSLWRDKDDYQIDWLESAHRILRTIYALGTPFQGAQTCINGMAIVIDEAELWPDVAIENRSFNVGKVIFKVDGNPVVVCGEGLLKLNCLKCKETGKTVSLPFRSRMR